VHGKRDRFLPSRSANHLFVEATDPCRLVLVEGMGHAYDPAGFDAIESALSWCAAECGVRTH
jgi:hypothetical protein